MKNFIDDDQHKIIKREFRNGKITNLIPLWHHDENQIDFERQGDEIDPDFFSEGFTILEADIRVLFKSFDPLWTSMFLRKELYKKEQCPDKISGVVYHWMQGIHLIPPTILNVHDSDCLFPADGKHRLNVAYFFGAETIPIIVANKQLEKVKRIMNLS